MTPITRRLRQKDHDSDDGDWENKVRMVGKKGGTAADSERKMINNTRALTW